MGKLRALPKLLPVTLAFTLLLLLIPSLVLGQVYQWVDEDGNVSFGDSPPDGAEAKPVDLPKGPSDEEVEKAQQELQDTLDARSTASEPAVPKPVAQNSNKTIPEFACYTSIEEVLRGPTKAAHQPASTTELSKAQESGARDVLSRGEGRWKGSAVDITCSGQIDTPRTEKLIMSVSSTGTWDDKEGLLTLANRARGSRNRVDETRVSYIKAGDALYFFQSNGQGSGSVTRNIGLEGNKSKGLYLDKNSLAFMIARRNFNVVSTEIRHLKVHGNKLEYTELYFHQNILTGSRVWTLSR